MNFVAGVARGCRHPREGVRQDSVPNQVAGHPKSALIVSTKVADTTR
jgi:hypothetical protein